MDKSAKAKKANAGQSVLSVCMGRVPVLSTVDSKPRNRKGMTYSASLSSLSLFSTTVILWVGPSVAF